MYNTSPDTLSGLFIVGGILAQRNYQPNFKKTSGRSFTGGKDTQLHNMYDAAWKSYRIKFLSHNKLCYACGKPATVVDHVIPHIGNERLFKKTDNHIPLCETDHNRITALFDKKYRAGNPVTPKLKWLADSRLARGLTFRVVVMPSYP